MNGLLSALGGLRGKAFAAEAGVEAARLKQFGLDAPHFRVEVTPKDGPPMVVRLGEVIVDHEAHYFAQQEGGHPVVELDLDWALKKLGTDIEGSARHARVAAGPRGGAGHQSEPG